MNTEMEFWYEKSGYQKKYFEILSLKTYKNCKSIILYFVALLKNFIGNFKC